MSVQSAEKGPNRAELPDARSDPETALLTHSAPHTAETQRDGATNLRRDRNITYSGQRGTTTRTDRRPFRPHYHYCASCPATVLCVKSGDHNVPPCFKCRHAS